MHTESKIRSELAQALEAARNSDSITEQREATVRVKGLQQELSEAITNGAKPDRETGLMPIGLRHVKLKGTKRLDKNGNPIFLWYHVYEVGLHGTKKSVTASTPMEEGGGPALERHDEDARSRAVESWNAEYGKED